MPKQPEMELWEETAKRIEARVEARLRADLGDRIDKRYTQIRDRFHDVGDEYADRVKDDLRSEIAERIQKEFNWRQRILYAFLGGFLLFITLGFLQRDFFFKPMHNIIYPPDTIFSEIEPKFEQLEISSLPKVRDEIPAHVWETLQKGEREQFQRILSNREFYNSLKAHFWDEMVLQFPQNSSARISPQTVMEYGKVAQDGTINVVEEKWGGQPTQCGRTLDHNRKQAIIALPRGLKEPAFGWLGCDSNYPMKTLLRITAHSGQIDEVELVGVERNKVRGKTPEVRVTRATAVQLGVRGAVRFKGKTSARFSVTHATN